MAEVGSAYVTLLPSARGFGSKLNSQIGGDVDKVGKSSGRRFGGHFGRAFGIVGGAIGLGAIIKQSSKLEQSFSKTMNLVAASTGAPKSAIASLDKLAMKLGADTQFSANDAAGAMLELAKAGISTSDIMGGALKGTLLLAAAGGTSLGTAATIAANAMNTFNLHGKDMNKIASALAGGANASSASVESLGQALQQVGPGATNAGLSLQQTVGTLSAFDAAGIKGSDAGTSLKTMLSRLVPQTDKARKAMEKYNLSFVDGKGNFDSITTVAQKLQDKLGPLSQAQRTQALQTIFGSDATRAATVLMKQGARGLAKYIKATKDQHAAQKMANASMKGTAGAMERLRGSVETTELALGKALAPTIEKTANFLSKKALPAVTKFIHGMQDGTGPGGDLADVIGDLAGAAKKVAGVIGGLPGPVKKYGAEAAIAALAVGKLLRATSGLHGIRSLAGLGRGLSKGFGGGLASGRGTVPVFVTNKGFGTGAGGGLGGGVVTGGKGGKLSKVASGGMVALEVAMGAALNQQVQDAVGKIGSRGKEGGVLGAFDKPRSKKASLVAGGTSHSVKHDTGAALNAQKFGGVFSGLDQKLAGLIGGDGLTKSVANVKALDSALAKISVKDQTQGWAEYNKVLEKSGLSAGDLNKVLPKTASALNGTARATGGIRDMLLQTVPQTARYAKQLRSMPKGVATKITAPGFKPTSDNVRKLQRQYNLTPKQLHTLVKLLGGPAAIAEANRVDSRLNKLNGKTIKTFIRNITTHENSGSSKPGKGLDGLLAGGGRVKAGGVYLVGEQGPELFTSSQSGRITPNNRLGAAGGSALSDGSGVLHLYDTDGILMGSMTAVADERYYANGALAR